MIGGARISAAAAALRGRRLALLAGVAIGLAVAVWHFAPPASPPAAKVRAELTIATTSYPGFAPIYVAADKGFFQAEGLHVTVADFPTGKAGLEAVVAGKADLVAAAELPFALALLRGERVAIVTSLFTGERDHGVIARASRGLKPPDLKGLAIALTPGTTSQFVLDLLLLEGGLSPGDVRLVPMNPAEMPAALARGGVDAASTWQPTLDQIRRQLGPEGTEVRGREILSLTAILAGRADFVQANPEAVEAALRALVSAVTFIRTHPDEAQRIISRRTGMGPELLRELWSGYRFQVRLDQSLVIALEDTSRWAIRSRLTEATEVPAFAAAIAPAALERIDPAAVSVIR